MAKLAPKAPAFCAACFQAGPEKRYVDFEAAYDGPVIPGTPEPVPVDDLVLCENCLSTAFALLDPQGLKETIAHQDALLAQAASALHDKDKLIARLEKSVHALVHEPVVSRGNAKGYAGVEKDIRQELMRRDRASEEGRRRQKKGQAKKWAKEPATA